MTTKISKPPTSTDIVVPEPRTLVGAGGPPGPGLYRNVGRLNHPWGQWFERLWTLVDKLTGNAALTDSTGGTSTGALTDATTALTDLSTSDTYTDAAVNAIFAEVEARLSVLNDNDARLHKALTDAGLL